MHLLPLASIIFFTTLAVFGYEWVTSPSTELINSMANRFLENPAICPAGIEIRLRRIKGSKPNNYEARKQISSGQTIQRKYAVGAKCIEYNRPAMDYKRWTALFEWKGNADNQELLKADVIGGITPISPEEYAKEFRGTHLVGKARKKKKDAGTGSRKLQGTPGIAKRKKKKKDAGTGSMRMNENAGTSSMRMNEGAGTSSMRMNEDAGTD